MEIYFRLILCLLSTTAYVWCQTITGMVMMPQKVYFVVLEGHQLKLECVVDYTGNTSVRPVMSKDGQEIKLDDKRYRIISTEQLISETTVRTKMSLAKNVTIADKGVYGCEVQERRIEIKVYVMQVSSTNADLAAEDAEAASVELKCNIDIPYDATLITHNMLTFWERDGKKIEQNEKFNTSKNTLQIRNPNRSDIGEYQCAITFFPDSFVEKQTVQPKPSLLRAGPTIDYLDKSKTVVKGDLLGLKCEVSGFPMPTVTWYRDKEKINTTSDIQILEYENATSFLRINSVGVEDEGDYVCLAENPVPPYSFSAGTRIEVTNTLDAAITC